MMHPSNRTHRRIGLSVVVLCVLLVGPHAWAQTPAPLHVILISIDGLSPEVYLPAGGPRPAVPTLRRLMETGAYAEAVIGEYPSITYPAHTTAVTGVHPARHGVYYNYVRPLTGSREWCWFANAIRVPTLWDVAKKKGLTTAAVSWPVTVGASIDYLIPEYWSIDPKISNLDALRRVTTPGLLEMVEQTYGALTDSTFWPGADERTTNAAVTLITRYRPALLLLHLIEADGAQHTHGNNTPEASAAFEHVDARIARVIQATKDAGVFDRTVFVVMGDHGFMRTHTAFHPNVLLAEQGWLTVDAEGKITDWQVRAITEGGYAGIVLRRPEDKDLARRVRTVFESAQRGADRGVFTVIDRPQLDDLGSSPEPVFCLDAEEGYLFGSNARGPALLPTQTMGMHGYLPTRPRMTTGFIASGPGIRRGVVMPRMRLADIGPTIAQLLGMTLPAPDGRPIVGILPDTK